jgi:hypothetical protein
MRGVATRSIRVNTLADRPQPVHEVRHPLSPELLVAEFAGELPPEVAQIVRQHVAACEACGTRARALAGPYEILAEMGEAPVAYVPDLRRPVRLRLEQEQFLTALLRAAGLVGRGSLATIAALCGLALLVALIVVTTTFQGATPLGRSVNGITSAPQAGAGGMLYAATAKVLQVTDQTGQIWPVAEVIAVDEVTGRVARSIPADGSGLHAGRAGELPAMVALAPDGQTLYELTAPQAGAQALLAFDTHNGQLRFATRLALPDGRPLPSDVRALGLAIAPDGQRVYVSLSLGRQGLAGPRALVLGEAGARVVDALTPGLDSVVPEPPVDATLPAVPSQTPVPQFVTIGLRPTLAADGALAVSPDGFWLFDALVLADDHGAQAVVLRRISAIDGTVAQSLALPGDFTLAALAASSNVLQPLLYLFRGGPDSQAYVIRALPAGPTLVGQVPLGGPAAQPGRTFTGTLALSPTADGSQVYVSADLTANDNRAASHDIWLVDGISATVVSHRVGFLAVGQACANWAGGDQGQVFVLLSGSVVLLPPDLAPSAAPPLWLNLKDGAPVWRLVGTAA